MTITGIIGALALFANSSSRKSIVNGIKETKDTAVQAVSFIKENRQEIVNQIKVASKDISDVIKDVKKDIQVIAESAAHIKRSSNELVKTTQEVAKEFKSWKEDEEKK